MLAKRAAWHDFTIDFDSYALPGQGQFMHELFGCHAISQRLLLTVHCDNDSIAHRQIVTPMGTRVGVGVAALDDGDLLHAVAAGFFGLFQGIIGLADQGADACVGQRAADRKTDADSQSVDRFRQRH